MVKRQQRLMESIISQAKIILITCTFYFIFKKLLHFAQKKKMFGHHPIWKVNPTNEIQLDNIGAKCHFDTWKSTFMTWRDCVVSLHPTKKSNDLFSNFRRKQIYFIYFSLHYWKFLLCPFAASSISCCEWEGQWHEKQRDNNSCHVTQYLKNGWPSVSNR